MEATLPTLAQTDGETIEPFDVDELEHPTLKSRLLGAVAVYPYLQRLFDLVRWWTPVLRVPILGLTFVLRQPEVRQVLNASRHFPVPWGWKMELVTTDPEHARQHAGEGQGRNFVLGMKEPDETYKDDYALLARAFPYEEARGRVGRRSFEATNHLLDSWAANPTGPVDLVELLVLGVPAALCDTYYGIPIPESERLHFAKCSLAVSSFLFGPDFDDKRTGSAGRDRRRALAAAVPLRRIIRRAMQAPVPGGRAPTPLQRLMTDDAAAHPVDPDRVHVQLFGMVMGFIPTNVLAAGNILETLLRQPEFMARAVAAVQADDDDRLWRCLRETLRFRNINFGPLRRCAKDFDLAGADGRTTRIRAGEKVLACTQAAMFDPASVAHPHEFDSARPDEDYLVFGLGQHWCVGAYIAMAQITQTFKVLLSRYKVEPVAGRSGRMRRFNVFPLHMLVQLTPR